jgi:thiamine kinase-like enzyme
VRPSDRIAPGPHHSDGLVLSFWEWIEELDGPADPRAAGRALRTCHEALSDFEGELPLWGAWREAVAILARLEAIEALGVADLATLRSAATRVTARLDDLDWPVQAVHGDAGPANALHTSAGVLWTDWEDTFRGPTLWDLACLVSSARILDRNLEWSELALEHYGPRVDDERLDCCIEARAFLITVWTYVIGEQHPEIKSQLEARLQWFRERDSRS